MIRIFLAPAIVFTALGEETAVQNTDGAEEIRRLADGKCKYTYKKKAGDDGEEYKQPHEWAHIDKTHCNHQCDSTKAQSPLNFEALDMYKDATNAPSQFDVNWHAVPGEGQWEAPDGDYLSLKYKCLQCTKMTVTANTPDLKEATTFELIQMHMHVPSENTVDGKPADGELHFVHKAPEQDKYLVIGILLKATDRERDVHPFSKHLFGDSGDSFGAAKLDEANWESLQERGSPLSGYFWHNAGSFTTPPCTEAVQWFVMHTPLTVHHKTITVYKALQSEYHTNFDSFTPAPPHLLHSTAGQHNKDHTKVFGSARPTQNGNNRNPIWFGSRKSVERKSVEKVEGGGIKNGLGSSTTLDDGSPPSMGSNGADTATVGVASALVAMALLLW